MAINTNANASRLSRTLFQVLLTTVRALGNIMLLLKTSKDTLPKVVETSKHALMAHPDVSPGELVLIAQTKDDLSPGEKPIRYRMEIVRVYEDRDGESERIWGRHWTYIVEGRNCVQLKNPFDISETQVTGKNYVTGGTFFYIEKADAEALMNEGYLDIAL